MSECFICGKSAVSILLFGKCPDCNEELVRVNTTTQFLEQDDLALPQPVCYICARIKVTHPGCQMQTLLVLEPISIEGS